MLYRTFQVLQADAQPEREHFHDRQGGEHVSIYLQLQNMRFHDSITFVSDIPDELTEYLIPKLTLQPVIENAVPSWDTGKGKLIRNDRSYRLDGK